MTTDNNFQYDQSPRDPQESGSEADKLIRSAKKSISLFFDLLIAFIGVLFIAFIIGSL